ncbi:uncharacterized protein LOC144927324 [Branchiostoma floridae x Branchiostoma belcheri]
MNSTESPSLSTQTLLDNVTESSDVATIEHGKTAALIIIMAASLVLNVLVIVVILRRKTALRTNHSTLILHMTLSELGLTVACMPLTILSVFDNGAVLKGSRTLCMANGFTSVTFPICSTMLLSIVSIDRYFAICKAVHYPAILSPFRLKVVVTSVWIFSGLCGIFPLFGWSSYGYHSGTFHCSPDWSNVSYRVTCTVIGIVVPSTIILFCYLSIFGFVRRSYRRLNAWRDLDRDVPSLNSRPSSTLYSIPSSSKNCIFSKSNDVKTQFATRVKMSLTENKRFLDPPANHVINFFGNKQGPGQAKYDVNKRRITIVVERYDSCHDSSLMEEEEDEGSSFYQKHCEDNNSTAVPCVTENKKKSCTVKEAWAEEKKYQYLSVPKRDKVEGHYPRHNRHSNMREEEVFYRAAARNTLFTTHMSGEPLHAPDEHQHTRTMSGNLSMSSSTRESTRSQSPGENDCRRERQQKIERRVALTGAILILTHFACWLPYTIIFGGVVQGLPTWAATLVMWLAYCSASVCPVVYALTHKQIITAIHRMCSCGVHSTEYFFNMSAMTGMPCTDNISSTPITNGSACNFTTPSFASNDSETSAFNRWVAVTTLVIIMVVSVILNGLVIVTMLQRKATLKSNHSLLVLNMALSGFGLSVICEPITLLSVIDGGTALKDWTVLCMINGFTSAFFPLLTTLLLSLLSVDRYLVICRPQKDVLSRLRLKITLAVLWLFSAMIGLPPLVGWSKYEYHRGTFHCSPDWAVLSYRLTCIFLGLVVPSAAIFYCYTSIFRFVRQNHRKLNVWRERGAEGRGSATGQTTLEASKRLSIPIRFLKGNSTAPLDETAAGTAKTTVGLRKDHDIEPQLSSCHSEDAPQGGNVRDNAKEQKATTSVEQYDSDRPANLNTFKEEMSSQKSGNIKSPPILTQQKKLRETPAFLRIVKSTRQGSFDQIRGEAPSLLRVEQSEFLTEGFPSRTVYTTQTSRDTLLVPGGHRSGNLETSRKKDRKDRENHKIQRKIALSAVIYIGSHFACWGPYTVIVGGGGYGLPLWVQTLVMWLAYSSTVVCPVVYALNNRKILKEVRRVCLCAKTT